MTIHRLFFVAVASCGLAGCFGSKSDTGKAFISDDPKFTSAVYGVAASPRVSRSKRVRKGGGRRQIGKPYKIRGKWYRPREEPGYDKVGQASWYGPNFHGRLTANGEVYDQYALSGAHPTFPLPSYARVTNVANGRSVMVRINDRGPYHGKRIIDLSARAAKLLDYQKKGVAKVRVQYLGQAPLHGRDEKKLVASFRHKGSGAERQAQVAYRKPEPAASPKPVLPPPGTGVRDIPQTPTFDTSPSGVLPSTAGANDPFLKDLAEIRGRRDTGSTVSLRLTQEENLRPIE